MASTRSISGPSRGGGGGDGEKRLEALALDKVAEAADAVASAACAGEIIEAATLRNDERDSWRCAFYRGPAFPTMSKILLGNVALKWLRKIHASARNEIYDSFFVKGPPVEVIQALVPTLLILCLLDNKGVFQIVADFAYSNKHGDGILNPDKTISISRVTQLLTSVPDKARLGASAALTSPSFFKDVISQLLAGAEAVTVEFAADKDVNEHCALSSMFHFLGEVLSRVSRRGSTGILVSELIPRIRNHLHRCVPADHKATSPNMIEHVSQSQFWFNMVEAMRDQHSIERLTEELLRQLASHHIIDGEAYWILWTLFNQSFKRLTVMRAMFIDKFLLWKTFPLCCLRWILHYAVFECPPNSATETLTPSFFGILQNLASIWSKKEFIQSYSVEQQAYITAAIGLCLEKLTKKELETTKDILNSILQGVNSRLERPIDLIRKMASAIALTFSKVVDPKNPLYLDENCCENVDWEFGILSPKEINAPLQAVESRKKPRTPIKHDITDVRGAKIVEIKLDHDQISDTARSEQFEEEFDGESMNIDASSDSSLEPYDLSDDDTDLQKKFSHLSDLAAALRKPDDPDGVDNALSSAEKFVRASPDELRHNSGDLARALVHVRFSDVAMEEEEDSAERKRQKALVALLVTCPFESLDVLTKLLYSSSVDVSQRILIIDAMTEAAQELAEAKIVKTEQHGNLITDTSPSWLVLSNRGPPGTGPWREVSEPGTLLSWSHRYEREVPSRSGHVKSGKSRKWGLGNTGWSRNRFPLYAAAFMLPVMQGYDKRSHGVDLLNHDFVVLGKLIYMLGVCMKSMAMHPEASALAPALLDMIRSRDVSLHAEAYVRRSVLFAASCILVSLHPSYVASSPIEGNKDISTGLEWIRTWALQVAESDPDTECTSLLLIYVGYAIAVNTVADRGFLMFDSVDGHDLLVAPFRDGSSDIARPGVCRSL
ncbi:hypothetical protein BS78_04G185600 [Paspalum vaginatum]|nr:hypothetical protein BS78_04G185600 [Paspalum vaginatum]